MPKNTFRYLFTLHTCLWSLLLWISSFYSDKLVRSNRYCAKLESVFKLHHLFPSGDGKTPYRLICWTHQIPLTEKVKHLIAALRNRKSSFQTFSNEIALAISQKLTIIWYLWAIWRVQTHEYDSHKNIFEKEHTARLVFSSLKKSRHISGKKKISFDWCTGLSNYFFESIYALHSALTNKKLSVRSIRLT